jgi:2-polyprenyl-3-methyl-5-hydroxy-6-metoxy-1,4-benzoquinol methylase
MDRHGPELSDLIVDYDRRTLERRDVTRDAVLARLDRSRATAAARRVARRLAERDGVLDREAMDGILVRAHLELQRLHEEFRVGVMMRGLVAPMIDVVRRVTAQRHVRIVDLGCGLGFVLRWLAARGELGPDVELIGADYNHALVTAAQRLADEEGLACRFVAANAFALREPAHLVLSTGVLHHFRGDDLVAVFAQHEQSSAVGFVHVDIRASPIAPIGSWIFHQARMREPLARFDGVQSTMRAHTSDALGRAIARGAPGFTLAMLDARPGVSGLLRIFQAAIGVRAGAGDHLSTAYAAFGRRFELVGDRARVTEGPC